MKKIKIFILLSICLFTIDAFAQTALEIADKASRAIDFESMEMASTLTIIDSKGRERIRKIVTATRAFNGVTKTIIRFVAPAEVKGTTMLVFDNQDSNDDMWIYLPALRKIRRIVSSERGRSFMGSEFTNADMGKPNLEDFNYKLLPDAKIHGNNCWVVEANCKDQDIEDLYGFKRQVSWIEKGNYLCHKIEYYDLDDELHRIQTIKDYRKQSGNGFFAFHLEKKNVQNGRKSILKIDGFQDNSKMNESAFAPNKLDK